MKANLNRFIIFALTVFFLSPIFIIFYYFKLNFDISIPDLFQALKNSVIQSSITALLCIVISLAIVPGLAITKSQWIKVGVLPSMLPSIFTILIVFSFFKDFPFGSIGIILIFFVTYFGLSTLILYNSYLVLVNRYSHLIQIYNISTFDQYVKIYIPGLSKDIVNVFLIIGLGCFSSLSVPLLAGGGKNINIEILIYESIFINGQWATASLVAMIQMCVMFLLGAYLNQVIYVDSNRISAVNTHIKTMNVSTFIFGSYLGIYIFGYLFQVIRSVIKINVNDFYFSNFFSALAHSFLLAILTILVFLTIAIALFRLEYARSRSQFLMYFLLPSSTVVGLALYLLFPENTFLSTNAFKIAIGLNIIYSLALYKSYIYPALMSIRSQLDLSQIYGLSFFESLRKIVFPQLKEPLILCATILMISSFCEFALIKAAGSQTLFAGVFIERLISTYRLEQGFIYSFIVLILVFSFYKMARFFSVKD